MIHDLKILPDFFATVCSGEKTFEVRKDDRPFEVGDILVLHEINCGIITGREVRVEVTYILRGSDYCKDGYCIMGIKLPATDDDDCGEKYKWQHETEALALIGEDGERNDT